MMQISQSRARPALIAATLLSLLMPAQTLHAVRVDGIYAETVPVADATPQATRAAFSEALKRVLVKATGQRDAGRDSALLGRFGDPSALVQQFRRDGAGNLWAQFDPVAVRRVLQTGGLPVWGDDRPLTVVWLAFDTGAGEREVLAGGGVDSAVAAGLRRDLLTAAQSRAVPLVLPLRDSQDLAAVSFADVWGDFTDRVISASARYQADAILIGRVRLFPAGMTDARWTLVAGNERAEWRGSVADGAHGLADRLAQRLASAAALDAANVRLAVDGISSFDDYGLVLGYLKGLDVVASVDVASAGADGVEFNLRLRGDQDRLLRALSLRRLLEPAAGEAASTAIAGDQALRYRLGGVR